MLVAPSKWSLCSDTLQDFLECPERVKAGKLSQAPSFLDRALFVLPKRDTLATKRGERLLDLEPVDSDPANYAHAAHQWPEVR
jgi:hypothetical protein